MGISSIGGVFNILWDELQSAYDYSFLQAPNNFFSSFSSIWELEKSPFAPKTLCYPPPPTLQSHILSFHVDSQSAGNRAPAATVLCWLLYFTAWGDERNKKMTVELVTSSAFLLPFTARLRSSTRVCRAIVVTYRVAQAEPAWRTRPVHWGTTVSNFPPF